MQPKSLLRKVKTASRFTAFQWRILLYACFLFLKVRFLLLFQSAQMLESALSLAPPKKNCRRTSTLSQRELLQLFRLAWRYQLKRPNCLVTALAQQIFLSHYGFPAQLLIGVRKENQGLEAHAWCEDPLQAQEGDKSSNKSFHIVEKVK